MALPPSLRARLKLPLIAAPMLRVSGPDLVSAACRAGVIGSFPTVNARSADELDAWLTRVARDCAEVNGPTAPVCPNIIMRRDPAMLAEDVKILVKHKVEMVIASVGSPEAVIQPLHDIGCLVYADIASLRHAEKALQVGADGLVLLTAGAGGQTGWANGLSFVRGVRAMFDGPLVLAGGISDGHALWGARALGCDLAYMGTRFIATRESLAPDAYRGMLVESSIDDVQLTRAFTGLHTSMLVPSILRAGLDPARLDETVTPNTAAQMFGGSSHGNTADGPRRWRDIWSAGHSVSGVRQVQTVEAMVAQIEQEFHKAMA